MQTADFRVISNYVYSFSIVYIMIAMIISALRYIRSTGRFKCSAATLIIPFIDILKIIIIW